MCKIEVHGFRGLFIYFILASSDKIFVQIFLCYLDESV